MSVSDTFFSSVGALIWAKVNVKLVEYDDSNYQESKKSKIKPLWQHCQRDINRL